MSRQWMLPGIVMASAVLGMLASANTLAAQSESSNSEASNGLVEQCHEQALKGPAGEELKGMMMEEKSNVSGYEPGEPYLLRINLHGHGNAFYNVTCGVDGQGKVTYESVEESGQPHG